MYCGTEIRDKHWSNIDPVCSDDECELYHRADIEGVPPRVIKNYDRLPRLLEEYGYDPGIDKLVPERSGDTALDHAIAYLWEMKDRYNDNPQDIS